MPAGESGAPAPCPPKDAHTRAVGFAVRNAGEKPLSAQQRAARHSRSRARCPRQNETGWATSPAPVALRRVCAHRNMGVSAARLAHNMICRTRSEKTLRSRFERGVRRFRDGQADRVQFQFSPWVTRRSQTFARIEKCTARFPPPNSASVRGSMPTGPKGPTAWSANTSARAFPI